MFRLVQIKITFLALVIWGSRCYKVSPNPRYRGIIGTSVKNWVEYPKTPKPRNPILNWNEMKRVCKFEISCVNRNTEFFFSRPKQTQTYTLFFLITSKKKQKKIIFSPFPPIYISYMICDKFWGRRGIWKLDSRNLHMNPEEVWVYHKPRTNVTSPLCNGLSIRRQSRTHQRHVDRDLHGGCLRPERG